MLRQIFVIGCPRSGANLASNIIARHPSCYLLDNINLATCLLQATLQNETELDPNLCLSIIQDLSRVHDFSGDIDNASILNNVILVTPVVLHAIMQAGLDELLTDPATLRLSNVNLVEVARNETSIHESLARFPALYEYLPNVMDNRVQFQKSVRALLIQSQHQIEKLRLHGWLLKKLDFDKMLIYGLSYVWDVLGLGAAGFQSIHTLKGVTQSISFRSREIDGSSFQRDSSSLINFCSTSKGSFHHLAPVIGTGRGGSGTRMLTTLFIKLGIYMSGSISQTGDSVSWADLIYEIALSRLSRVNHIPPIDWNAKLYHRRSFVLNYKRDQLWGLKLPEIMLILPEILSAWPDAKLIHIVRHPVETCLRRSHVTSTPKSVIGSATLKAAYASKYGEENIYSNEEHFNNAISWWYQLSQVIDIKNRLDKKINLLELRYEDICLDPQACVDQLTDFLGIPSRKIEFKADQSRRVAWDPNDLRCREIWNLCKEPAEEYGYKFP